MSSRLAAFLIASVLSVAVAGCDSGDPRQGYLDVQRLLLSHYLLLEPSAIRSDKYRNVDQVEIVDHDDYARIRGRFSVPEFGDVPYTYRMIVSHNPETDSYRALCFSVDGPVDNKLIEIFAVKDPCFP